MPQLSQLMQLFSDEKAKWNNSPKLMDLLMRDSSTKGLRDYAGNVQQRGETLANLVRGVEPTDAQKALFSIANPGTEQGAMEMGMGMVGATAWHGSPHLFDKFDMKKIGTGEGMQAYGHGLYFSDNPEVAAGYQKRLSGFDSDNKIAANMASNLGGTDKAIDHIKTGLKTNPEYFKNDGYTQALKALESNRVTAAGSLYKVDIPDESINKMLDWDKPLSGQSAEVQAAIRSGGWNKFALADEEIMNNARRLTGLPPVRGDMPMGSLLKQVGNSMGGQPAVSDYLKARGIPGIRYLDGNSRGEGGTSNYVLFDDQLPRILERNGAPTGQQPWGK